jgi:hypothetical protein
VATPDQLWIKVTWGIVNWRFGPHGTAGRLPLLGFAYSDNLFGCREASWAFPATAVGDSYAGKIPLKGARVVIYNGPDEDEDAIWIGRIAAPNPKLTKDRAMITLVARGYATHAADLKYDFSHTWPSGTSVEDLFTDVRDLLLPKLDPTSAFIFDGGRTLLTESPDAKYQSPQELFNWAVAQGFTGDEPLIWGVRLAKIFDDPTYTAVPALSLHALPDRNTPRYTLTMADDIRTLELKSDLDEVYTHVQVFYSDSAFEEAIDALAEVLYDDTRRTQVIEAGRYTTSGEAARAAAVLLEQHKETRLAGSVIEIPYQHKVYDNVFAQEIDPELIQTGEWIEIPDLTDTGGVPEGSYLVTQREYQVSARKTQITLGRQKSILDAHRQLRTETQEAAAMAGQPRVQTIQTLPQALQTFFAQADGGTTDNPPVLDEDELIQEQNIPDWLKSLDAQFGINGNGSAVPAISQDIALLAGTYTTWRVHADGAIAIDIVGPGATGGSISVTGNDSGSLSTPIVAAAGDWVTFTITGTPAATKFTVAIDGMRTAP